jgi:hypothetical protein
MSTLVKCAACGREISPNAASCPQCGEPGTGMQGKQPQTAPLVVTWSEKKKIDAKEFETAEMVMLVILCFLIPIAGLIVGIMNLSKPARNNQAVGLIWISILAFIIDGVFIGVMSAANARERQQKQWAEERFKIEQEMRELSR